MYIKRNQAALHVGSSYGATAALNHESGREIDMPALNGLLNTQGNTPKHAFPAISKYG
jgi:hypothetical protein